METQALSGKDHTFLHLHVRSAGDNWAAVSMSAMAVDSHDSYSCSCDLPACEGITPFIQKNGALRTPFRLKTKPADISWVLSFFLDRMYKKWYNKAAS